MSVNACDPCDTGCGPVQLANNELTFRVAVLTILCKLIQFLGLDDEDEEEANIGRAFSNVAASGTTTVVNAVADKKIRVTGVFALAGSTATALTFKTHVVIGGAETAISPVINNAGTAGEVMSFNPQGWMETAAGDALVVTAGAGSTTALIVTYVLVDG